MTIKSLCQCSMEISSAKDHNTSAYATNRINCSGTKKFFWSTYKLHLDNGSVSYSVHVCVCEIISNMCDTDLIVLF